MSATYTVIIATEATARDKFMHAMSLAKTLLDNGEAVQLTVAPALSPIGIQQRRFLKDVVCQQIAEQVQVELNGKMVRYNKTAWAEYYRKEFLGHRYEMEELPGQKRKHPKRVRNSTEELGVKKYSEHTDRVIDHAVVEWHVEFHFTREERDEVRYVSRPRATKVL